MSRAAQSPASRKTKAKASTTKAKPKTRAKSKAKAKPVKLDEPVAVPATPEPQATTPPPVTDEQIAQRAYDIWVEKGRPYGQEDENWAQAVAELRG